MSDRETRALEREQHDQEAQRLYEVALVREGFPSRQRCYERLVCALAALAESKRPPKIYIRANRPVDYIEFQFTMEPMVGEVEKGPIDEITEGFPSE